LAGNKTSILQKPTTQNWMLLATWLRLKGIHDTHGTYINNNWCMMIEMFLAWFHVPVTATEWLWEHYGICKTLSTSVTTTNRGQDFFYDIVAWSIRHKIISSSCATQTTNTTRCEPSCVSSQCRNYITYHCFKQNYVKCNDSEMNLNTS